MLVNTIDFNLYLTIIYPINKNRGNSNEKQNNIYHYYWNTNRSYCKIKRQLSLHLLLIVRANISKARVVQVVKDNIIEDGTRIGQQDVIVKILSGHYKGQEFNAKSNSAYLYGANCIPGMKVMVSINEHNGYYTVNVTGYTEPLHCI